MNDRDKSQRRQSQDPTQVETKAQFKNGKEGEAHQNLLNKVDNGHSTVDRGEEDEVGTEQVRGAAAPSLQ